MPLRAADRLLLGNAGLELDEPSYIDAVAGAGVAGGRITSPDLFDWSPRDWKPTRRRDSAWSKQDLMSFIADWRKLRSQMGAPRVRVAFLDPQGDTISISRVLSLAGAGSVFVPASIGTADLRMKMPLRIGAWPDDFADLKLADLAKVWPASTFMVFHELSREQARCDIVILRGGVRSALQRILTAPFAVRASLVLLVGPSDLSWQRTNTLLASLLTETQAAGASLLGLQSPGQFAGLFLNFAAELSHNTPLDQSLHRAFHEVAEVHLLDGRLIAAMAMPNAARVIGRRVSALPSGQRLDMPDTTPGRIALDWTSSAPAAALGAELIAKANALPFGRESEGATALSQIGVAEEAARAASGDLEPVRHLQADIHAIHDGAAVIETRAFIVHRPYRLEVFIGGDGEGVLQADKVFPDKELDWQNADQFTLGVVFSEANQWPVPQTGHFKLGRYGTSTRCSFDFTPTKVGPFVARVTIHYRGRVLQTALLQARVVESERERSATDEPLRLTAEMSLRQSLVTLDDRRAFDACVVLNKSSADIPTLQAAGPDGAFITSLEGVGDHLERISSLLTQIAQDADLFSKGLTSKPSVEMLVKLSHEGYGLYGRLVLDYIDRSAAATALRNSVYLQIVAAKSDDVVPLEMVYEYWPTDANKICPNAEQALRDGSCPPHCVPKGAPAPHVCPMGFWGLRKVIERHVHDPGLGVAAKVTAEPLKGRNVLPLSGSALLAASERVPSAERKKLKSSLDKSWKLGAVNDVQKWADWKTAITARKPVLLVALPHSVGKGVELGLEISGDMMKSLFIDPKYVRASPTQPPPLLLLMGCDVTGAGNARAYISHIAHFRQHGASLILGTVALVDGTDAAIAAALMVKQLAATLTATPTCFGETLRAVKRQAIADGLLMTLGLVGFGDADWQLRL